MLSLHNGTFLLQLYVFPSIFTFLSSKMLCSFSSLSLPAFLWWHLLCPFAQLIFSYVSFYHNLPLNCSHVSQCLVFSSASSGSFSFYFYITHKVTCLQAVCFLPYLFFSICTICVCLCNRGAPVSESDIVLC